MKFVLSLSLTLFCFVLFSQNKSDLGNETIQNPGYKRSGKKPSLSLDLDSKIPEGSGLVAWNGKLWTHNDSGDSRLFELDSASGKIVAEYNLPVENIDWEEISQDHDYFYLGDFGNNFGRRDHLFIYRIQKQALLNSTVVLDTISFSWPGKINPDCEAMVAIKDSIYLFTKEWKTKRQTRVFSLPNQPGNFEAKFKSTLKTKVLVTGASFNAPKNRLVLCGYNIVLRPFVLIFDDVATTDFFSQRYRKIKIRKRFRQVEGIATFDAKSYYLINEDFTFSMIHTKRQLHKVMLAKFLDE